MDFLKSPSLFSLDCQVCCYEDNDPLEALLTLYSSYKPNQLTEKQKDLNMDEKLWPSRCYNTQWGKDKSWIKYDINTQNILFQLLNSWEHLKCQGSGILKEDNSWIMKTTFGIMHAWWMGHTPLHQLLPKHDAGSLQRETQTSRDLSAGC